ncbi:uncharacterized protein PHACADRAFT_260367 [Phanerochaete carnosa HHB-10118-sp]|uniref:F-box domain-containing protein n=1 Tax=Phanerochaete carnosa (strain HHB-10118-sp) TaxID=650164 RepID=K5W3Z5_PHACS|nr:uncharacterized protein PHACADRAFT_260367 [Phanerochaete carnosa HHB-10118-sp]EKM53825.1 hypothetical protein PHACADRAFT_260367 [Phanerochaete carnosa HHB-10118-sp]
MHPCLNIDEIVQNIAGHVGTNSSLHSFAVVCRAFVEPANDRRWVGLNGLKPLVNCLPDHLVGASKTSADTLVSLQYTS